MVKVNFGANFINTFTYFHVDGVVDAGLFICQLIGGNKISSFPVSITEETSMCWSRWINVKHIGNVESVARYACKGTLYDFIHTLQGCEISAAVDASWSLPSLLCVASTISKQTVNVTNGKM